MITFPIGGYVDYSQAILHCLINQYVNSMVVDHGLL